MNAWIYNRYGDSKVLEQSDIKSQELKKGQIAVSVKAFSINPIDWKIMSGQLRFLVPQKFPVIPCFDVAGIVEDDNGTHGYKNGDKVFVRLKSNSGGAARKSVSVDGAVAAKIPENLSFAEAAAMPLAGLTALQGLRDYGGLDLSGSKARVLIVGASGGVGHYAVQIARASGAHVTAVCGSRNVELVSSLGANEVIDYRKQSDFKSSEHIPYDIIFDCVGQKPLNFDQRFASVLKKGGVYVTPIPTSDTVLRKLQFWKSIPIKIYFMKPSQSDLDLLGDYYRQGKLKTVIDSEYAYSDLPAAFEKSMSGRAVGKIVVSVNIP